MNPASRIYNIVNELKKFQNKQTKLIDVYKQVFHVETAQEAYKGLLTFNQEVKLLEQIFKTSNKYEKYKSLLTSLNQISLPNNTEQYLSNLNPAIDTVLPQLYVLEDALETHHSEEVDVSEKLEEIIKDIDQFEKRIFNLDLDPTSKLLYFRVTTQLKESINFYKISGIKEPNYVLQQFKCITKNSNEANTIYEKLSKIIGDAANVSSLLGFVAGNGTQLLLG